MADDKKKKSSEQEKTVKNESAQPEQKAAKDPVIEELPEQVTLSKEEFEQVKDHIDKLQKEKDDTVLLAQRLQADFDNYRKRNATVHLDGVEEGKRNLMKDLLSVLDNFDRAMENCESVDKAFLDGVKLVQRQLIEVLSKNGLEEIPADGKFDPELHEAVMQDEAEDKNSGDITAVFQKGYRVNNRIIRHSMVKVAK